ncbi:hypothetical protein J6590_005385 [Homalodisca vitripennis]|nr:hypothetical protein J6590_005385 [Homalodisca vitripennis]
MCICARIEEMCIAPAQHWLVNLTQPTSVSVPPKVKSVGMRTHRGDVHCICAALVSKFDTTNQCNILSLPKVKSVGMRTRRGELRCVCAALDASPIISLNHSSPIPPPPPSNRTPGESRRTVHEPC